jgi:hypothetical protein
VLRLWGLIVIAGAGCETFFPLDRTLPPAIDAPPDCSLLEESYKTRIVGRQSRYRIEPNGALPWLTAEEACEADLATSHLFSPDDIGELDAMQAMLPIETITVKYWIGVARAKTSTTLDFQTVNDDVIPRVDSRWQGGEPNDGVFGGTAPAGNTELAVFISENQRMVDAEASQVGRFICECDDRPPIAIEID